jgi:hypothetical protein
VLALFAAGSAAFGAAPKSDIEVVTTEHADIAAGGTIRFEGSYGELNIETWDQPDVELVVTRSTYVRDVTGDREQATQELNNIRITVEKESDGLVIRTPRVRHFHHLARLDYRVMVPRGVHLVIRHETGDVVIGGVEGEIDARVKTGDILLRLPSTVDYTFDAYCREGQVLSDFPGMYARHHLIAEHFSGRISGHGPLSGVNVQLHVGIGAIDIRKL